MFVISVVRNLVWYLGGENKGKYKRESVDNSVVNCRIC